MKRLYLIIALVLLVSGCTQSSIQYTVPDPSEAPVKYRRNFSQIGVEKITLPAYLEESKIAVETEPGVYLYKNALWAVPLQKRLRSMLVSYLQHSFSTPEVYEYPWGIHKERGLRLKVNITRFIYSGRRVVLEAGYHISRIPAGANRGRLFSVSVEADSDTRSIIGGMGRAYNALMKRIAADISRSF